MPAIKVSVININTSRHLMETEGMSILILVVFSLLNLLITARWTNHDYIDSKSRENSNKGWFREKAVVSFMEKTSTKNGFQVIRNCEDAMRDHGWSSFSPPTPLIHLDRKRYLYPATVNGPSNQLLGFQESVFIAIQTNRTLVIPPFMYHLTEQMKSQHRDRNVPPQMRIDLKQLSRLVSVASVKDMQKACDSHFDVGMQVRPTNCNFEGIMRYNTNMSFSSPYYKVLTENGYGEIKFYNRNVCMPPHLPVRYVAGIRWPVATIERRFRSNIPCMILINPYQNLEMSPSAVDDEIVSKAHNNISSLTSQDLRKCSKDTLLTVIEYFAQRPSVITEIAKNFVKLVMGEDDFVAMHWRYNSEWKRVFCYPDRTEQKFCSKLFAVNPKKLAAGLFLLSKNLSAWNNGYDPLTNCTTEYEVKTVNAYLASPTEYKDSVKIYTNDKMFLKYLVTKTTGEEMSQRINESDQHCLRMRVFTIDDLMHFLEDMNAKNTCSANWSDLPDLLSIVENQICHLSTILGYSLKSSWSKVALQRRARLSGLVSEISVLDVLDEVDLIM